MRVLDIKTSVADARWGSPLQMYDTAQHPPANQKGRENAAPIMLPAASADSVQTAVVPFQTSAKEAVPTRSASNRGPLGMSTSKVLPLTATLALPPGGSLADLHVIQSTCQEDS